MMWRKTAIANKKSKTDRDCEQFLHFYHAKIVIIIFVAYTLNTTLNPKPFFSHLTNSNFYRTQKQREER